MSTVHEHSEALLDELRKLLAARGMSVESAQYGEEVVLVGRLEGSGETEGELLRVAVHLSKQEVAPDSSDSGVANAAPMRDA